MSISHLFNLSSDLFLLEVQKSKHKTDITFKLLAKTVRTSDLPHTHNLMEILLPGLCKHKCYNNKSLSFSEELRNTEIGHLFEHIILEHLFQIKENLECDCPIHKGETKWNWLEEEKGIFHISIDIGLEEGDIFMEALNKGIETMKTLLNTSQKQGDGSAHHLLVETTTF